MAMRGGAAYCFAPTLSLCVYSRPYSQYPSWRSGAVVVLVLMAGVREKLELATVPQLVEGTAITLMIAGILSLSFMGFAGLGAS